MSNIHRIDLLNVPVSPIVSEPQRGLAHASSASGSKRPGGLRGLVREQTSNFLDSHLYQISGFMGVLARNPEPVAELKRDIQGQNLRSATLNAEAMNYNRKLALDSGQFKLFLKTEIGLDHLQVDYLDNMQNAGLWVSDLELDAAPLKRLSSDIDYDFNSATDADLGIIEDKIDFLDYILKGNWGDLNLLSLDEDPEISRLEKSLRKSIDDILVNLDQTTKQQILAELCFFDFKNNHAIARIKEISKLELTDKQIQELKDLLKSTKLFALVNYYQVEIYQKIELIRQKSFSVYEGPLSRDGNKQQFFMLKPSAGWGEGLLNPGYYLFSSLHKFRDFMNLVCAKTIYQKEENPKLQDLITAFEQGFDKDVVHDNLSKYRRNRASNNQDLNHAGLFDLLEKTYFWEKTIDHGHNVLNALFGSRFYRQAGINMPAFTRVKVDWAKEEPVFEFTASRDSFDRNIDWPRIALRLLEEALYLKQKGNHNALSNKVSALKIAFKGSNDPFIKMMDIACDLIVSCIKDENIGEEIEERMLEIFNNNLPIQYGYYRRSLFLMLSNLILKMQNVDLHQDSAVKDGDRTILQIIKKLPVKAYYECNNRDRAYHLEATALSRLFSNTADTLPILSSRFERATAMQYLSAAEQKRYEHNHLQDKGSIMPQNIIDLYNKYFPKAYRSQEQILGTGKSIKESGDIEGAVRYLIEYIELTPFDDKNYAGMEKVVSMLDLIIDIKISDDDVIADFFRDLISKKHQNERISEAFLATYLAISNDRDDKKNFLDNLNKNLGYLAQKLPESLINEAVDFFIKTPGDLFIKIEALKGFLLENNNHRNNICLITRLAQRQTRINKEKHLAKHTLFLGLEQLNQSDIITYTHTNTQRLLQNIPLIGDNFEGNYAYQAGLYYELIANLINVYFAENDFISAQNILDFLLKGTPLNAKLNSQQKEILTTFKNKMTEKFPDFTRILNFLDVEFKIKVLIRNKDLDNLRKAIDNQEEIVLSIVDLFTDGKERGFLPLSRNLQSWSEKNPTWENILTNWTRAYFKNREILANLYTGHAKIAEAKEVAQRTNEILSIFLDRSVSASKKTDGNIKRVKDVFKNFGSYFGRTRAFLAPNLSDKWIQLANYLATINSQEFLRDFEAQVLYTITTMDYYQVTGSQKDKTEGNQIVAEVAKSAVAEIEPLSANIANNIYVNFFKLWLESFKFKSYLSEDDYNEAIDSVLRLFDASLGSLSRGLFYFMSDYTDRYLEYAKNAGLEKINRQVVAKKPLSGADITHITYGVYVETETSYTTFKKDENAIKISIADDIVGNFFYTKTKNGFELYRKERLQEDGAQRSHTTRLVFFTDASLSHDYNIEINKARDNGLLIILKDGSGKVIKRALIKEQGSDLAEEHFLLLTQDNIYLNDDLAKAEINSEQDNYYLALASLNAMFPPQNAPRNWLTFKETILGTKIEEAGVKTQLYELLWAFKSIFGTSKADEFIAVVDSFKKFFPADEEINRIWTFVHIERGIEANSEQSIAISNYLNQTAAYFNIPANKEQGQRAYFQFLFLQYQLTRNRGQELSSQAKYREEMFNIISVADQDMMLFYQTEILGWAALNPEMNRYLLKHLIDWLEIKQERDFILPAEKVNLLRAYDLAVSILNDNNHKQAIREKIVSLGFSIEQIEILSLKHLVGLYESSKQATASSISDVSWYDSSFNVIVKDNISLNSWRTWKNRFIQEVNIAQNKYYLVKDPSQGNQVVSEGIAYGLLLAVQNDDRDAFERILSGYRLLNQIRDRNDSLTAWRIDIASPFTGKNDWKDNATDADQDIAAALILASQKWSDAKFDDQSYQDLALKIITDIATNSIGKLSTHKDKESLTVILPSNDWQDSDNNQFSDINLSYLSPQWYNLFYELASQRGKTELAQKYQRLSEDSYKLIDFVFDKKQYLPDWLQIDSQGNIIPVKTRSFGFGYESVRVIWRLIHAIQNGNSKAEKTLAKITAGVSLDDIDKVGLFDAKGSDRADITIGQYEALGRKNFLAKISFLSGLYFLDSTTQEQRNQIKEKIKEIYDENNALFVNSPARHNDLDLYFDQSIAIMLYNMIIDETKKAEK